MPSKREADIECVPLSFFPWRHKLCGLHRRHDIVSLEKINAADEDAAGLRASAEYVEGLVRAEEASGIPTSRCAFCEGCKELIPQCAGTGVEANTSYEM